MSIRGLMTRQVFDEKLKQAQPGDTITYHVGVLVEDRMAGEHFMTIHNTARAAWEAFEAGKVELFQRRILGEAKWPIYAYIAIKKLPPHKPVKWSGCYGWSYA